MNKKIFIITGGSSGIGLSCIQKLSENKHNHVISFSRSKEKTKRAAKSIGNIPDNVEFYHGDVRNESDCETFAGYIGEKYGKIHGLVHAAAVLTKGGIEMIPYEAWKFNLDINLNGPYLLTQVLLPYLKAAQGASIVNISSIAAQRPGTSIAYSVSKAGLDMLTEFLAGDLAPYQIRVNSVNPGLVTTNIHLDNKIVENQQAYDEMVKKAAARYPLNRAGKPEEIADMILYLLSEKSSWVTGSIFKMDGGALIANDLIPDKQ
ncbi:MAG: SDR family oxidoreductase [Bacteroidetes bacterium]|nr:MAG: SDR family oxidoreductase [Bacteroidota bacterium]